MEEELITFEIAKLAKEKKFDLITRHSYNPQGTESTYNYLVNHPNCSDMFPRPPQSLLQKWLREEHKIHINVFPVFEFRVQGWTFKTASIFVNPEDKSLPLLQDNGFFKTYEEALEAGLFEALKLIK